VILALRRRHRAMTLAVTVFGLATLIVGLARRSTTMADGNLGAVWNRTPAGTPVLLPAPLSTGSGIEYDVRRRAGAGSEGALLLGVRPTGPLPYPEGYLFWQPGREWSRLSSEAVALGPLVAGMWTQFPLPPGAEGQESVIVVYSAGFGAVVDGGLLSVPADRAPAP